MSSEREHHEDGSYTDRYSDGQSWTYDADGNVQEHSQVESNLPFGIGLMGTSTVTYDSDGNVSNVQENKDT